MPLGLAEDFFSYTLLLPRMFGTVIPLSLHAPICCLLRSHTRVLDQAHRNGMYSILSFCSLIVFLFSLSLSPSFPLPSLPPSLFMLYFITRITEHLTVTTSACCYRNFSLRLNHRPHGGGGDQAQVNACGRWMEGGGWVDQLHVDCRHSRIK